MPPARHNRKIVDFRQGNLNYDHGVYNEKLITLHCFWKSNKNRADIREVSSWLSGRSTLRLDIEREMFYRDATIENMSTIQAMYHRGNGNQAALGEFTLNFTCFPFAISRIATQAAGRDYTYLDYEGTAKSPTTIIIRNNSNQPMQGITITLASQRQ